ncbi:MAG: hypothetical protein V1744_05155 [Candidatus Altiarchaeota archaeon]
MPQQPLKSGKVRGNTPDSVEIDSHLMPPTIKSLKDRYLPNVGMVLVDNAGNLADVVEPQLERDYTNNPGSGTYSVSTRDRVKTLTVDGTWQMMSGFDSPWERSRGFLNIMGAMEDIARIKGCGSVKTTTWIFTAHPKLMEKLGYRPLDPTQEEKHNIGVTEYPTHKGRDKVWNQKPQAYASYVKELTQIKEAKTD